MLHLAGEPCKLIAETLESLLQALDCVEDADCSVADLGSFKEHVHVEVVQLCVTRNNAFVSSR